MIQASNKFTLSEAELKVFEPQLKFKPRLKYGWFHLKLYSMFQDLSRRSIETGFDSGRKDIENENRV